MRFLVICLLSSNVWLKNNCLLYGIAFDLCQVFKGFMQKNHEDKYFLLAVTAETK